MRRVLLAGAALAAFSCAQAQDWREIYERGYRAAPEAALEAPPAQVDGPAFLAPNVVPIVIEGGRAHVGVTFGDDPACWMMVIDTGASIMGVSKSLAATLVGRGLASAQGTMTIALADGTPIVREGILIHRLNIGNRVLRGVEAIVNPNGVEMLLPFGVLSSAGRFTIDVRAHLLIFGG